MNRDQAALEARVRMVAEREGYRAIKSTKRTLSVDNGGGFMLVEATTNRVEAGERFDMSAEQVLEFFKTEG
ncbi:hypothetical protein LOY42_04320 [Pseudomonas sp. B21-023]|uniref:hypothetical protein n=1 Tax=Pseudomonas sp. B21-023 TaxID=2895477 RepID=UPI00215F3ABC|nr:hypothetical protein [Pseudomonas sp. B21-023]UVM17543.1 hypothetical protein LOY42_04320 [Pseudomonas sp. B21-023]